MSDRAIPLTIISGYLGAGKTTLVNHLLRQANGRRLAVMVNEFGALPIDADLIEAQGDDLITLAGGCVCCSYGDDLMLALTQMLNLDPRPDHILLEASGVALPGTIAASIGLFSQDISIHGIVVLADAETLPVQTNDIYLSDTITRQLNVADLVILTKSDLASEDQKTASHAVVATHAAGASLLESNGSGLPAALLLADFETEMITKGPTMAHDLGLQSHILPMHNPVNPEDFAKEMANDPAILRAKGHLISNVDQTRLTLQLVGSRYVFTPAPVTAQIGVIAIEKMKN